MDGVTLGTKISQMLAKEYKGVALAVCFTLGAIYMLVHSLVAK